MLRTIVQPYLLCVNIPAYRDSVGRWYLDRLWYVDLRTHLDYIENLYIACPCVYEKLPQDTIALEGDPAFLHLHIIELPQATGVIDALKKLPVIIHRLWRAVGQCEIVHAGIAGWPIPLGWLLRPIVSLRKKIFIIIIESAPWRINKYLPHTFKQEIKAFFYECMANWCIVRANIVICTSSYYRDSFLKEGFKGKSGIIPASWVDETSLISQEEAIKLWRQKSNQDFKILFVGRLVQAKGILVLLKAMELLKTKDTSIGLDILGEGDLLEECRKTAQRLTGLVRVTPIGVVPYGEEFFNLLRHYSVVIIPSLSDEQPRIIFDAYSQAIPVFASDTFAFKEYVKNGKTGKLFSVNDSVALAQDIQWALSNRDHLPLMGTEALSFVQPMTHEKMHDIRRELLLDMLEEKEY